LSACPPSVCTSQYQSLSLYPSLVLPLSLCLPHASVCLSFCSPVWFAYCQSVSQPVRLSQQSVSQSVSQPGGQLVFLSVPVRLDCCLPLCCSAVHLPVCLSVYMYVCLSGVLVGGSVYMYGCMYVCICIYVSLY